MIPVLCYVMFSSKVYNKSIPTVTAGGARLRKRKILPYRPKLRRTKVPKIWLATENFVRRNILSAKIQNITCTIRSY